MCDALEQTDHGGMGWVKEDDERILTELALPLSEARILHIPFLLCLSPYA